MYRQSSRTDINYWTALLCDPFSIIDMAINAAAIEFLFIIIYPIILNHCDNGKQK